MDPNQLGNRRRQGGKRVKKSANDDLYDLNALGIQLLLGESERDEQTAQQVMADFDWLQIDESLFAWQAEMEFVMRVANLWNKVHFCFF